MQPVLVGLLLAALAVAALIAAGWTALRTRAFVKRAGTTVGVVVDFVEETSDEHRDGQVVTSTYFYPVVRFQPPAGDTVEFRSNVGSSRPRLRKGQQIAVLYDPDRPADARIRSFIQIWWLPAALAFIAALLASVGAGLMVFR